MAEPPQQPLMAEPPQPPRGRSKYTEDVQLPGAFEGEIVSRRRFMTASASTAGLVAAAAFNLPALGFAIAPVFDRASATWQELGSLSRFTESDYVPVVVTIEPGVGEAGNSIAYVRKHNLQIDGPVKDQYEHVIAISSRCVHVGCPVRYVAASQALIIRAGQVLLGPRFSVNDELRRFAPRDPGEPLEGIGPFLYPPRFSTPPAPPGANP
jgi:menaquinol-cytochrome c reductase iron-sulfur subunit